MALRMENHITWDWHQMITNWKKWLNWSWKTLFQQSKRKGKSFPIKISTGKMIRIWQRKFCPATNRLKSGKKFMKSTLFHSPMELEDSEPFIMISTKRNQQILDLAERVRKSPRLKHALHDFIQKKSSLWIDLEILLEPEDAFFYNILKGLTKEHMDYSLNDHLVGENLNGIISIIYKLSEKGYSRDLDKNDEVSNLELKLYFSAG